MTASRDPERLIHAFLLEGAEQLHDQVYDAVRAEIEQKRQRAVIGPWRVPNMSKFLAIGLGGAAVVVALVIGAQLLGTPSGGVGAPPTATPSPTPIGGTVEYLLEGATSTSTTVVDAVADGASVSGTAVTTIPEGTHEVLLECAARDGDTWAFGGTVERTTVSSESTGHWSAVIVKDGPPQQIAIWLSDVKSAGSDCAGWLAAIDLAGIGAENFAPVESGTLVPPPDLAP